MVHMVKNQDGKPHDKEAGCLLGYVFSIFQSN